MLIIEFLQGIEASLLNTSIVLLLFVKSDTLTFFIIVAVLIIMIINIYD